MELNDERGSQGLTNEATLVDNSILLEEQLHQLGRSLHSFIPRNGQQCKEEEPSSQIQRLRLDLLHTAKSNHLSPSHGVAALNALCGFLDICSTCQNDRWSFLCFSTSTCEEILHIYLTKSENFKPKPMRQLLFTLTNALSKYPNKIEKALLIKDAVACCVRSISKQNGIKTIKSSILALEQFINKKLISGCDIIAECRKDEAKICEPIRNTADDYSTIMFSKRVEDFTLNVLDWVRYPDCASAIYRFLPCFYASLDSSRGNEGEETNPHATMTDSQSPLWIAPVRRALERDLGLLESFESHVLPSLLQLSSKGMEDFLKMLPLNELQRGEVGSQSNADIQLCLLVVKMMSLKRSDETISMLSKKLNLNLNRLCINLIDHDTANVRLAAFSLMVSSSTRNEPLHSNVLVCLQRSIPHFHQETNPKTRNDFIALMKHLYPKLAIAAKTFLRLSAANGARFHDFPGADENLMQHINLARWYQHYLLHELRPGASYQSHITALKVLPLIFTSNILTDLISSNIKHPSKTIQHELRPGCGNVLDHVRPLLDLLVNPFEDVRQSALVVLDIILPSTFYDSWMYRSDETVDVYIRTNKTFQIKLIAAVEMALGHAGEYVRRTGRADHADGMGRLHKVFDGINQAKFPSEVDLRKDSFISLLSALEQALGYQGKDLPQMLSSTSIHQFLIALRYLVGHPGFEKSRPADEKSRTMQNIYSTLLACCSKVWNAVRGILCYDAPEGRCVYDDDEEHAESGSKDTLSICWRALKESSLLMHTVVDKITFSSSSLITDLDDACYGVYGKLLFTQLAELRHRGAFSTVAETFAAWCLMCSRSTNPDISGLPREWYQEVLACIQQQASAITRRSAGLPAMMTGILAACKSSSFFDTVVLDLQAIADAETEASQEPFYLRLPQVHALNCLKDIFIDSRFGSSTERHTATSLAIAISSLECDIWAIRNSGLMLLNALLKRLNGGADTASTRVASSHRQFSPLIYERFPILPQLLLKLILHQYDEASSVLRAEQIFPALEIVERFGVPEIHREEIMRALDYHRACPNWAIREKAAKAFGMTIESEKLVAQMSDMIYGTNLQSQNEVHGCLLSLRVLFARAMPIYLDATDDYGDKLFTSLLKMTDKFIMNNICPLTVAAALNILADMIASPICHKGAPSSSESRIQDLVLTILLDDMDVQLFLGRLKHLLQKKREDPDLHSLPGFPAFVSESDPMSRCRAFLENVDVVNNNQIPETRAGTYGRKKVKPREPSYTIGFSVSNSPGNPHQSDGRLRVWGGQVAAMFTQDRTPVNRFTPWVRALYLALSAYSEVSTRLAAVISVDSFFSRLYESGGRPLAAAIPVELLMILYDTLVDDDEDVRNRGAGIVSCILSNDFSEHGRISSSLSLSQPSARSRLLQYLASRYNRSVILVLEAVWRLTGMAVSIDIVKRTEFARTLETGGMVENATSLGLTTVPLLLERATQQQNAVFEEEKQNLYLDMVTEAKAWAQVITEIDSNAWPPALAATMRLWTANGLACLLNSLNQKVEGPLGLTSKPDVFVLFVQVAMMAMVLLSAFSKRQADSRESKEIFEIQTIMTNVKDLYEHGKEKDLHPLILNILQSLLHDVNQDDD